MVRAPMYFQDLILTLSAFWSKRGCLLVQPYNSEVGAGTLRIERMFGAGGLGEMRLAESRCLAQGPLDWDTLRPLLEADSQVERDARRQEWDHRVATARVSA